MKNKNIFLIFSLVASYLIAFNSKTSAQIPPEWNPPGAGVVGRSLEGGAVKKGHYVYDFDLNKSLGKYLCYSTGEVVKPGSDKKCPLQAKRIEYRKAIYRCMPKQKIPFYRPYGVEIVNRPSVISWGSVPGASSYVVIIEGGGKNQKQKTINDIKETSIPFPSDIDISNEDSVYSIVVIAQDNEKNLLKHDGEIIASNIAIDYIKNAEYMQDFFEAVKLIKSLKVPYETLLTVDLASIYSNAKLFEEITPKVEELLSKLNIVSLPMLFTLLLTYILKIINLFWRFERTIRR